MHWRIQVLAIFFLYGLVFLHSRDSFLHLIGCFDPVKNQASNKPLIRVCCFRVGGTLAT
jgi:hypothetical protein